MLRAQRFSNMLTVEGGGGEKGGKKKKKKKLKDIEECKKSDKPNFHLRIHLYSILVLGNWGKKGKAEAQGWRTGTRVERGKIGGYWNGDGTGYGRGLEAGKKNQP